MGLNISKGNMYEWVTHTWSPISGCVHQCKYCYVRTYRTLTVEPKINRNDFPNLGEGKTIFVGHMCDMFSWNVPIRWIEDVYNHCIKHPKNKYVFQTKNPGRLVQIFKTLSNNFIIGTTIETDNANLVRKYSQAPLPKLRAEGLSLVTNEKFLTIEPIMKFDIDGFIELFKIAKPNWINIGADSKGHNLPEPTITEIQSLVTELEILGIQIRKKVNLQRLTK